MFGQVGTMEIVVVLVIALIVLGPKRLPEVARSVGRGMRELKESMSLDASDDEEQRGSPSAEQRSEARSLPE